MPNENQFKFRRFVFIHNWRSTHSVRGKYSSWGLWLTPSWIKMLRKPRSRSIPGLYLSRPTLQQPASFSQPLPLKGFTVFQYNHHQLGTKQGAGVGGALVTRRWNTGLRIIWLWGWGEAALEDMTQRVKCLLYKYKDPCKIQWWLWPIYKPNTVRGRDWRVPGRSQSTQLVSATHIQRKTLPQKNDWRQQLWISGLHMCLYEQVTCTCEYTCMLVHTHNRGGEGEDIIKCLRKINAQLTVYPTKLWVQVDQSHPYN